MAQPAWVDPRRVACLAMVVAAGLLRLGAPRPGTASVATPSVQAAGETPVPAMVGLWSGKPLGVEERALDILETDDVALMEYRMGVEEPPVWLAQVAGFGDRAAFHPPELCYVGSHFEVLERGPIDVIVNGRAHRLMRLVIGQGGARFEAWYWFTANGRVTPSYYAQQAWLLLDTVRRKPASGTLVRISTRLDQPGPAKRRLLAFVASWDAASEAGATHES